MYASPPISAMTSRSTCHCSAWHANGWLSRAMRKARVATAPARSLQSVQRPHQYWRTEDMDKELETAGLALRRQMFGKAGAEDALNNASDFRRRFEEIVTEQCFGDAWNRPPLDHRMRS